MEKISVLMSTYNEPIKWIKQAVNSILEQTYKNIEFVIIVDNPQNIELIEVLSEYRTNNACIKLIINEKNMGLVSSLNEGLEYCTGKYIARMDADDISEPERLDMQYRFMKKYDLDLIGSNFVEFFGNQILMERDLPQKHESIKKILKHRCCVQHPTWLVKKEVYTELKGYRMIDACEDYDFLVRAILNGFKLGNIKLNLLNYRDNKNSISHNKKFKQQATMLFIASHYRKGKIMTLEQYDQYLNSSKYQKKVNELKKMSEGVENIKNTTSLIKKMKEMLGLLRLWTYIRWKISNKIINTIREHETILN